MPDKRVLVVDDEPSVREFVHKVLTRNGFECLIAVDAAQALACMNRQPADLVVTDVQMPGSNGAWLLDAIKEQWPDVPVIMLTGNDEAEMAVACLKSGAADYLLKPFEVSQLLSAIRSALRMGDSGRDHSPEDRA